MEPKQFTKLLAGGEIALGAALLAPFVPEALAGAGLTAFSAGLLGRHLRTPGMRKENSLRPTRGAGMVLDAIVESRKAD